jgi:hypothetical protein
MRPAFLAFLLSIVLISMVGPFTFFKVRQNLIHRSVRERISSRQRAKSLILINVPPSHQQDLVWEKPGKEFRYKGNMYDVVRSERQGSNVLYYCFKDDDETTLMNRLSNAIAKDQERSGPTGSAYQVLLNLFASAMPFQQFYIHPLNCLKAIFCFEDYRNYFSSGFYKINSPPPDNAV